MTKSEVLRLIEADYRRAGIEVPLFLATWLPSSDFVLRRIDADAVASPALPHTPLPLEQYPNWQAEQVASISIVVDTNIYQAGKAPNIEFAPDVIVVVGVIDMEDRVVTAYVGDCAWERLR